MKGLNLYAGLGGNRLLWGNDHDITAVEMDEKIANVYHENNPGDEIVIEDAHYYLLHNHDKFDFIWSSPPCQSHSKMMKATRHDVRKYPDMKLYEEIIFLKNFCKGKWVVENVKPYYSPLIAPSVSLGRHLFWSNFTISHFDTETPKGFITTGTSKQVEEMKKWLGINYEGNIYYKGNHCPGQVLRNCVHPKLGLHVFNEAMGIIEESKYEQCSLF